MHSCFFISICITSSEVTLNLFEMNNISADYVSYPSESEDKIPRNPLRQQTNYVFKSRFGSVEDAKTEGSAQKSWTQITTTEFPISKRIYYDWKWSRECPAKAMVVIPSYSQEVLLHISDATHNHELIVVGIPKTTKNESVHLITARISKPNAILRALRGQNIAEPKKRKLEEFLSRLRAKTYKSKWSTGNLLF